MNVSTSSHSAPHKRDFRQNVLAMLGLCFVIMLVALDQTVIGTALPTVVAELKGFELYAWVGTAYLLASVVTVPVFGRLGDEHGRKPFVIAAIALFTLASMLCGQAQSMMQLVLARAAQGVGGGMLVATSFACVPDLFPDARQRLRWQIMLSTSFGLANAIGPTLGGYLTEYWGWRWVFFVNLPVGLASIGFVWRYLPRIRHSDKPPSRLDWQGALLVALSLGSLQLLMEQIPQHKPFYELLGLAAVSAASFALLVWWERRCPNPVLPMGLMADRRIAPLFALSVLMGFCLFAVMYYAPLMFQGGFGLSPNEAGLLITPLAVSITVGSIANGRIVTRLKHPNTMLYVGLACFTATVVVMTQATMAMPRAVIIAAMSLGGIGIGLLLPNLTLFAQASAPRTQLGIATAMLQSTRMIGSMVGTALSGVLVHQLYTRSVPVRLADPQVLVDRGMQAQFLALMHQAGQNGQAMLLQARHALVDAIHISQWIVLGMLVLAWLVAKWTPRLSLHGDEA